MAPESFSLVNVYRIDELAKGRKVGQKSEGNKSVKTDDIELVMTPKVNHRKVEKRKRCYQHHRRHHDEARAQ